jgi:hypothetical protein
LCQDFSEDADSAREKLEALDSRAAEEIESLEKQETKGDDLDSVVANYDDR